MPAMTILGIESSCDDTSVALLEAGDDGFRVLKELTASQIEVHKTYGGVVPEIAAREHAEAIMPVIEAVLDGQKKPDCIAVTAGPGLITSLLVGVEAAKTLSYLWDIPLVAVNHIAGHIHSVELHESRSMKHESKILFPALALVVSGGHTELILMKNHGDYERVGATRDDAAGECFDKAAKLLGFEYPGGPKISTAAEGGNPHAIEFPRPMIDEKIDFSAKGGPAFGWSFAGLKTSALYWLRDHAEKKDSCFMLHASGLADFCASFEQAIVDVLVAKTLRAAKQYQPKSILLVGGVSANKKLRSTLEQSIRPMFHDSRLPAQAGFMTADLRYCMDNGAMIAAAGYYKAIKKEYTDWRDIIPDPTWRVREPALISDSRR
jgi:N6-L-threonylcarbamoyladenine synthase